MLQNHLQWGHVKDMTNISGRGCWQGCELSLQPRTGNAPRTRSGEQECALSAGEHKRQSGHQQTPQFANSIRKPGGTVTDPLPLRDGPAEPGEARGALRVWPRGGSQDTPALGNTAHRKQALPSAGEQADIALWGKALMSYTDTVCPLLILPQQRAKVGCQRGCVTYAAPT